MTCLPFLSHNIPSPFLAYLSTKQSVAAFQKLLPDVEIITQMTELWNPVGSEATKEPEGRSQKFKQQWY